MALKAIPRARSKAKQVSEGIAAVILYRSYHVLWLGDG
jgi:hypothetical protein